ncbi:hypothetical protein [Streptomyces sulphureus]|uniref:hypothetical protein n=1 Tax=Streptomyces sulphureus TaxID=47758 RepID=UPI00039EDC55|nr:hypothetical protein [Streptomyces sulphureus]
MSDAAQPSAADVRAAAEAVKAALDRHLEAVERRAEVPEGTASAQEAAYESAVYAAFDELAQAGEAYDELLYEVHDEVTPFEIPSGDGSATGYRGPALPSALNVFARRDYTVVEPERLLAHVERLSAFDPEAPDSDEEEEAGAGVHSALGVLFGEYEPDEIAVRHKEFGLERGDSTLWVAAADEPAEPGEWFSAPFDQADQERVVWRFDSSPLFDDEDTAFTPLGGPDEDDYEPLDDFDDGEDLEAEGEFDRSEGGTGR